MHPGGVCPAGNLCRAGDRTIVIIGLQRGMPSKRKSLACVDYVPCLLYTPPVATTDCELMGRVLPAQAVLRPKPDELVHLEEVKSRNKVSVGEPAEGSLATFTCVLMDLLREETPKNLQ